MLIYYSLNEQVNYWDYAPKDVTWMDSYEDKSLNTMVYNITVEDTHTYFVGEHGVWVHNINCHSEPFEFANVPFVNKRCKKNSSKTLTTWMMRRMQLLQSRRRHMGINLRCGQITMPKQ